jgi:hypothetical protein
MRPSCFAAFSLALVFTSFILAHGQSTQSVAGVGAFGSGSNLCYHDPPAKSGPTSAKCGGTISGDGYSGAGTSQAAASYSSLGVAGDVALNNDDGEASMAVEANAFLTDFLSVGNYPDGSNLFIANSLGAAFGGNGGGTSTIYEQVEINDGLNLGECLIEVSGQNSCSTQLVLAPVNDSVTLSVYLDGTASFATGEGGSASFSADDKTPGGAKILVIKVVDSNGNPVKGATITSASGHKYPTDFASTTTLTSSPNPSEQGDPVTFTATIASFGRSGAPTGKVTFKDSTTGTTLGHATLSSGVASLTTSSLATGTQTITATYGGDVWSASSHGSVSQVVN